MMRHPALLLLCALSHLAFGQSTVTLTVASNPAAVGTAAITAGTITGLSTPLPATSGGTGVANNAAATLTRSGNHGLTLTTTATTALTLPTSGTLATQAYADSVAAGGGVPIIGSNAITGTLGFTSPSTLLWGNYGGAVASQAPVFTVGGISNFAGINSGAPAGQEDNTVASIGWNMAPGSGRLDTTKPAMGLAFENNFRQSSTQAFEFHGPTVFDTSGTEHRVFSAFMPRDGGAGSIAGHHIDQFYLADYGGINGNEVLYNLLTHTVDHNNATVYRFLSNNYATHQQRNAANSAYLSLPFVASDDRLDLGTTKGFVQTSAVPTTGTYANVAWHLQTSGTLPTNTKLLNIQATAASSNGDIDAIYASAGATTGRFRLTLQNLTAAATGHANIDLLTAVSGGNPHIRYYQNGGAAWSEGMDAQAAGTPFKISNSSTLGTGNGLTLTTGGNLTITGVYAQPQVTPASASATCTANTIMWDTGFIYVCTATNTLKRTTIATW